MESINILLLEDDFELAKEMSGFLQAKQFSCDVVYNGSFVEKQLLLKAYDIILLDINVPGIDGLEVCKRIRVSDKSIPILMLTAFGEVDDKVNAFNRGADDYLVKPFHFDELLVRMNALLRRRSVPQTAKAFTKIADLNIDIDESVVSRGGKEISLTPKEFKLLKILADANGRVLSKQSIADKLWDYHIETSQNTIEVYINFLRNKIDKGFDTKLIHTKVGFGYYLKEEA
jgi:DNA-binding response OmpR family regulator